MLKKERKQPDEKLGQYCHLLSGLYAGNPNLVQAVITRNLELTPYFLRDYGDPQREAACKAVFEDLKKNVTVILPEAPAP